MAASPSNSQPQHEDLNATDPQESESQQPPEPPHSETLETPDPPNPQPDDQEIQNPDQPDKKEDTLLVLEEKDQQPQQEIDHQSGTMPISSIEPIILADDTNQPPSPSPPPPPPVVSPTNPRRPVKRKKGASRNTLKRKKSMKKVKTLTDILNPIPFKPTKMLDFDKHEEVLKRLGLWEFSRIEFDRSIRTDLVSQLIANYDSKRRCSYVNDFRINVNRAVLARALKLPPTKQEKGNSSSVEEVDLDSDVFSDEAIGFIEDFVSNWVLLHDDTWMMSTEIMNWTRCIRDGHPEKMDSSSLIWYMVEKELTKGDKLTDCYYASHLQYLIKSQREEVFMLEMEVEEVKDEDDGVAGDGDGVAGDGDGVAGDGDGDGVAGDGDGVAGDGDGVAGDGDGVAGDGDGVAGDGDGVAGDGDGDGVTGDDDGVAGDGDGVAGDGDGVAGDGDGDVKVEEEEEENVSVVQERNLELNLGPDVEEEASEEVMKDDEKDDETMVEAEECKEEDEQGGWLLDGKNVLGEHFLQRCQGSDLNNYEDGKPEEVDEEQVEQVDDEDEEEEEAGERVEDGFDMEANNDSLDRDGLTDNFLQGMETSHIPFGSQGELRGMSSVDLFGSRDGSFMGHGGSSFFGNGGKRAMEPEEDIHHHSLDGNNKRLKTEDVWSQKPTDFGLCMEQMQHWMEKAKMIHESKEQSYGNSQFNQQIAINQLQERQNIMEIIIKSKDEELEKKHAEVFRLERELYLMGDLLAGYRKALNDSRSKFSEYRKQYALSEEPLYKDAGPGGLVLSTKELEKQRLKQEEDRVKFLMLAKDLEEQCTCKLEMHHDKVLMMVDKLVAIENEVKRLKELSARRKEIQKPQDEQELSAQPEENQKSQDEVPENDTSESIVPPDAAESKEAEGGEE